MVRISRRRRTSSEGAFVAEDIQVERPSTHLLPDTSLVLPRGGIVVAIGSTEIHCTSLALALAGRLRRPAGWFTPTATAAAARCSAASPWSTSPP